MMFNKNRKAQGEIITTILIILLVLAAVVILWQVVQGTVTKGGEQVSEQSECIGVTMDVTSAVAGSDNVTVRRGQGSSDTSVTGYKVFVEGELCGTNETTDLAPLDTATITLGAACGDLATGDKVEAAPIVSNSIVCNPSTYYTVE